MAPGEGSIVWAMVATVQHNKGCITAAAEYLQGGQCVDDRVGGTSGRRDQARARRHHQCGEHPTAACRWCRCGHRPRRGPELQRESTEKAPIGLGEAVETTAGDMPARYVIHAATMELGGPTSGEIITAATAATLRKADELGCRSLALVAFGTGVGGFPLDDAARLMVGAVRRHRPGSLQRVVFAVHGDAAERAFSAAIQAGEDTARR